MRRAWVFAGAIGLSCWAVSAQAAMIQFNLQGKGGAGLLPTNENGTVNPHPTTGTPPGTGGEVGAGITFDDVTRVLTLNVAWGSGNGFTDLTGPTSGGHIHGPTTGSGTTSFTQNASVLFPLDTRPEWNSSATSGGFSGTVTLSAAQATELMDGRYYLNVHTTTNGPGEARGNLVAVPEPAALGALGLVGLSLAARRRRTP